jgi:XTP/dITP diphosphohydrolase
MITICTGNRWKFEQIAAVLRQDFSCVQQALDLFELQTNDMLEVSRMKAIEAFKKVWWPVLVDDSGIYFDAYPDFPGVFSKYIFQSLGVVWLQKLFVDQPNINAWHQCVLTYMDETLQEPKQFVWTVAGVMDFSFLDRIQPDLHLPYDALFRLEDSATVVQLDMALFTPHNHRARASRELKEWLSTKE